MITIILDDTADSSFKAILPNGNWFVTTFDSDNRLVDFKPLEENVYKFTQGQRGSVRFDRR